LSTDVAFGHRRQQVATRTATAQFPGRFPYPGKAKQLPDRGHT
jgi:hypothetical protein